MKNWKNIGILTLILVFAVSFAALAWNDGVYVGKPMATTALSAWK